ncbi:hypothetical protein HGRIS_000872 [Hohenbuehelia grisea]|uniref:UbiA prenyltransferase n=1 Tax=Hohenbuehelia grisea TaxID=104357 RepID=A0ABR3IPZ9_9AGAR
MAPLSQRSWLSREAQIFLGFTWRDWSTTLIPMSILSLGPARTHGTASYPLIIAYAILFAWVTFFLYFFNLSNQITGVDEDRINKPDRPIPSDLVSLAGAKTRWVITLGGFLALAIWQAQILLETLTWVVNTGLLCLTGYGSHWFTKNAIGMGVGTWALMSGSWKIIAPVTDENQRQIIAIAVWFGILLQIQDLRDLEGDRAIGRKTLPLAIGERAARIVIVLLIPAALVALGLGGVLGMAPLTLGLLHVCLGYRVLKKKGAKYDHKTYMILTYVFCFMIVIMVAQ